MPNLHTSKISILVNDYEYFETQAWFDKKLQKVVSVSASVATAYFNKFMWGFGTRPIEKVALFDSRAFVIPREEACNYFCWRQQDAERNSVSSLAQAHFSHNSLQGKNVTEMKEMLLGQYINWDDLPISQKRGRCVRKDGNIDNDIPRFQESREYIDHHLVQIEI